jgi:exopolyphosphatase/pppGpp-phosphohydrolase
METNYAVIDIGSLKTKLLIANIKRNNNIQIIKKDSKLTLMGDGLSKKSHRIKAKSFKDTVMAIKEYLRICDKNKVKKIKLVATESLRKASNLRKILEKFEKEISLKPLIITQEEEAKVFYKAVMKDFKSNQEVAISDMGGGSVQVLIGNKSKLKSIKYLPLGTYLLNTKMVKDNREDGKATDYELHKIRKFIKETILKSDIPKSINIPLIYGSSNILDLFKFLKLKVSESDLSFSHPYQSKPYELLKYLSKIKNMTHIQREKAYPFQWGFMWGIQISFYNAYYLAKHLETKTIIPSNVNIAEGYILEMAKTDY